MERGNNAKLKGLSVRYLGEDNVINSIGAYARPIVAAKAQSELKHYSPVELNFLLMYEKSLYLRNPKAGPWLDAIISAQDVVMCEYPMYAPLLSDFCKKWGKPLVVTSHDMLFELHGAHPGAKQRLRDKELHAMALADALVFCNDRERQLFGEYGLDGVTVLNTGDVLALDPGREAECRERVRGALKIRTANYCLFVGSAHGPNVEAVAELRRVANSMPDMTFVVAGQCHAKAAEGNFIATGKVSDEFLDALHRGALSVLVPLLRGTGISVKLFHALAYGKAVISTPMGARGHAVADQRELLLAATPADFPAAILRLMADEPFRRKIETAAREYAIGLDFREHFQPYGDILSRLAPRVPSPEAKGVRSLVLVDNNLSDRIGHHFNYALSLKEQCSGLAGSFGALIREGAPTDVLTALSAHGAFSQGIHEEGAQNPFPAEWGSIRATYDFLRSNDYFARELEAGLAETGRPFDCVFLPNATPRQMLGLALLLRRNPIFRTLQYVLILRYSVYIPSGPLADRKTVLDKESAERYATAIEKLQSADYTGAVRFTTDSAGLAKEFSSYSKRPIEVLPIPHTLHPPSAVPPGEIPPKDPLKIRVIFLGDAREEKGFELLPAAVRACTQEASVEFVFQAFISSHHHNRMALVIEELVGMKLPQLHLVRSPLSPDAYHALLDSADLVLIPYDAATYRSRTSGPFVEAICAGKPVVVPRDSWMSAQLGSSRAGATFKSGIAVDFERAVIGVLAALPDHAAAAAEMGRQFRAFHNPSSFLSHLLTGRATSPANIP
jgi:glycosyltransferase involved in cell wall biosynthesis